MAPPVRGEIMRITHRRGRTPSPDLVASNGLIDRRALLGSVRLLSSTLRAGDAVPHDAYGRRVL
jgi:hypothetical protein